MASFNIFVNEKNLVNFRFYFGDISREEAEMYLKNRGKCDGTFLVRGGPGMYKLSVISSLGGESRFFHYIIQENSDKTYNIGPECFFSSVVQLIDHYRDDFTDIQQKLTVSCPRMDYEVTEDFVTMAPIVRDVVIQSKLKEGKFHQIWKGTMTSQMTEIVIKSNVGKHISGRSLLEEASIIDMLRHDNIVKLIDVVTTYPVCVTLEYEDNGDLLDYLLRSDTYEMPAQQRIRLALEVALGMEIIASKSVVHRSICASNILLGRELSAKISGFGFAKLLDKRGCYQPVEGDKIIPQIMIRWMALEAASEQRFSTSSDVWSFACLLVELFTDGESPFSRKKKQTKVFLNNMNLSFFISFLIGCHSSHDRQMSFDSFDDFLSKLLYGSTRSRKLFFADVLVPQVLPRLKAGGRPKLPRDLPEGLCLLASKCWQADPTTRPNFTTIQEVTKQELEHFGKSRSKLDDERPLAREDSRYITTNHRIS
ncbi:unnamed protein product [Clavelina lepadiformis]|uniref:Tyrosine-protein kinase n=1 Tax=Clavelina lepadiformis TaxID=159417 RepID=A0ABP0GNE5_CLALP